MKDKFDKMFEALKKALSDVQLKDLERLEKELGGEG